MFLSFIIFQYISRYFTHRLIGYLWLLGDEPLQVAKWQIGTFCLCGRNNCAAWNSALNRFHHISQLEKHRNSLALSQEHLAFQDKVFEGISHQHLRNRTSFTIHCYSMLQYVTIYYNVSRVFGIHRFKFQHCTARHVGHFLWVSWSGVETVRPSCRGSASFGGLASGTWEKTNLMVI